MKPISHLPSPISHLPSPASHLPPDPAPMIDLTRSIDLPRGSLSPGADSHPQSPWPALRRLTQAERRAALQEAHAFTRCVLYAGLAFFTFVLLTLTAALLGWM